MSIDWNKVKSNAKAKDDSQYEAMKADTAERKSAEAAAKKAAGPKFTERVGKTVTGAGKGSAAGFVNAGGVAVEGLGTLNTRGANYQMKNSAAHKAAQNSLKYAQQEYDAAQTDAERAAAEKKVRRWQAVLGIQEEGTRIGETHNKETAEQAYRTADALSESSAQDIQRAKEGLGKAGQLAVDVGVAGTQLAGDLGASLLIPGAGVASRLVQGFGSGAQEARQSGASLGQQMAYGAGSAAVGLATEKLSNIAAPFKKAFGAGFADELVEKLARKLGQNAAVKTALSALGEGIEEFVEDAAQPILQRATYDPEALAHYKDPDYWADALYDGLVGAALGGIGGAVSPSTYARNGRGGAVESPGTPTAGGEGNVAPQEQKGPQGVPGDVMGQEVQRLFGQQKAAPGAEAAEAAEAVHVGRVTTIKRPYQGVTPVQTQRMSGTVEVHPGSVRTAQSAIQGARGLEGSLPGKGFKATLKETYKSIFKPAKGVPVEGMTFEGKPYAVDINSNVPGKVISDPNLTAEKLALLETLPEIVQHGEYVGSGEYVQHGSRKRSGIRYDYFETPVTLNGQTYIAKFDVEVLPGANNYRTHQLINMDLTTPEARLAGPAPVPSSNVPSPVEGTRPLNSDSTIPQGSNPVKGRDPLLDAILGGKRVEQASLSQEQFDALADRDDLAIDTAGKVYQVDPAQHIDRRTPDSVGSRTVNAFQFDHPELKPYYQRAAQALIADADLSLQFPMTRSYERGMQGNRVNQSVQASEHLRLAMDETGLSRAEIIDAAQRILHDQGQENVKAAKQVEIILDYMLEHGWSTMMGDTVQPDQSYITEKGRIAGSQPEAGSYIPEELDGLGAANAGSLNSDYDHLQAQSDTFHPEGPYAARPVDVPTTDFDGRNVPKSASTVMGAQGTTVQGVQMLEQQIADGTLSFDTITDQASVSRAQSTMQQKGFDGALEQYRQAASRGVATKDNTTLGQQLLLQAMREGNEGATAEILALYTRNSTTAAQAMQAQSILRKLSPEGQLVAVQKAVDALNEKYGTDVELDPADVADFLNAKTDDARREAQQRMVEKAAQAVPGTFRAKYDTLRYLAMLGNPRTHIRNILGNAFFQVPVAVKNRVGAVAEAAASAVSGGKVERTKSLFGANPLGKLAAEARADWANAKDFLSQSSKYMDGQTSLWDIEREADAFSNDHLLGRGVNKLADLNSRALEAEDTAAKYWIYSQSLAGYLKANGCKSLSDADPALLNRARTYAAQEALRNTFNDRNVFSDAVSRLGRLSQSDNKAIKKFSYVTEGVLPFKKTPANIAVRAVEYSPIGAVIGAVQTLRGARAGDTDRVSAGLDRVAAGVSGTALLAAGFLLAGQGAVTGGEDEDKEQAAFNDLTGHQNYALELKNGTSVTLDWLAPEAIPFFMGVELNRAMQDGGLGWDEAWSTVKNITEPMLEMSMLQGLNDTFDNAAYAHNRGGSVMGSVITSALTNYFTQIFPTIGGQIERSGEDRRMTTYTDKNSDLPSDLQYAIGKVSQKIPGWDYQQVPYIDAWGREEETGDALERSINSLFNPAYISQVDVDQVEGELQRLADATGDGGVFPQRAARSIEYTLEGKEKITHDLTAEQYVKYAKKLGQDSYAIVKAGMDTAAYRSMNDGEKLEYLDSLYNYAAYSAKRSMFPDFPEQAKYENAKNAQRDIGKSAAEYLALYEQYGSEIMSGKAYEKTKQAVAAGLTVGEYKSMKDAADADSSGRVTKGEAISILDGNPKRVDLWDIICTTGAHNPYQ